MPLHYAYLWMHMKNGGKINGASQINDEVKNIHKCSLLYNQWDMKH
jgi:hypothetical protein